MVWCGLICTVIWIELSVLFVLNIVRWERTHTQNQIDVQLFMQMMTINERMIVFAHCQTHSKRWHCNRLVTSFMKNVEERKRQIVWPIQLDWIECKLSYRASQHACTTVIAVKVKSFFFLVEWEKKWLFPWINYEIRMKKRSFGIYSTLNVKNTSFWFSFKFNWIHIET